jgi:hypothetical protein
MSGWLELPVTLGIIQDGCPLYYVHIAGPHCIEWQHTTTRPIARTTGQHASQRRGAAASRSKLSVVERGKKAGNASPDLPNCGVIGSVVLVGSMVGPGSGLASQRGCVHIVNSNLHSTYSAPQDALKRHPCLSLRKDNVRLAGVQIEFSLRVPL